MLQSVAVVCCQNYHFAHAIDELRDVRRRPRSVRIDAVLGGQIPYFCPPSTASMRTNQGRRHASRKSSLMIMPVSGTLVLLSTFTFREVSVLVHVLQSM